MLAKSSAQYVAIGCKYACTIRLRQGNKEVHLAHQSETERKKDQRGDKHSIGNHGRSFLLRS